VAVWREWLASAASNGDDCHSCFAGASEGSWCHVWRFESSFSEMEWLFSDLDREVECHLSPLPIGRQGKSVFSRPSMLKSCR